MGNREILQDIGYTQDAQGSAREMTDAQFEAAWNVFVQESANRPTIADTRHAFRAALAAAQAETIQHELAKHWWFGHGQGFAAGIEAAARAVRAMKLYITNEQRAEAIRALRPPAAPAGGFAPTPTVRPGYKWDQTLGWTIDDTPPSASEPAGAPQKAQLLPLPDRLRGLASRHAAVEWPELQSALIEAAKALEPAGTDGHGACAKCGATWYTPDANLPCPVCTLPEPAGAPDPIRDIVDHLRMPEPARAPSEVMAQDKAAELLTWAMCAAASGGGPGVCDPKHCACGHEAVAITRHLYADGVVLALLQRDKK